jgi:hypothetical protein
MKFIDLFEKEEKKSLKDYHRKFEDPLDILRQNGIKIAYSELFLNGYFVKLFKKVDFENILKDFKIQKEDDLSFIVRRK